MNFLFLKFTTEFDYLKKKNFAIIAITNHIILSQNFFAITIFALIFEKNLKTFLWLFFCKKILQIFAKSYSLQKFFAIILIANNFFFCKNWTKGQEEFFNREMDVSSLWRIEYFSFTVWRKRVSISWYLTSIFDEKLLIF